MAKIVILFSSLFLFIAGEPVDLAGDGRYDSPGHTARYCTYTLMDAVSEIMECLQKTHLGFFQAKGPSFRTILSDGYESILAFHLSDKQVKI